MEWGAACVGHLNGIFAFGIWDEAQQQLFLARDRFGVKPLFYAQREGGVLFGSEPKALLANPLVSPTVDLEGLSELFAMFPLRTPGQSIYKNVKQVRPGYSLRFNRSGSHTKEYWKLESYPHTDDVSITAQNIRELILSPHHIARMYFPQARNGSYMRRRLAQLWRVGLVMRMRPAVGPGQGSAPYLYALSNLGISVLKTARPDLNPAIFWREDAQGVSLTLIRHEVALNDFFLDMLDGIEDREGAAERTPTKLTRQSFKAANQEIRVEPDALIRGQIPGVRGDRLLHVELELSADMPNFRQKLRRWTAYRSTQAWHGLYSRQPRIVVVGYAQAAPVPSGRKRRIVKSIRPLQASAQAQHFTDIAFCLSKNGLRAAGSVCPIKPTNPASLCGIFGWL